MNETCRLITLDQYKQLKKIQKDLEEAKKTLKFYAETRIGEKTERGTYMKEIKDTPMGTVFIEYDPQPAIDCLERIK